MFMWRFVQIGYKVKHFFSFVKLISEKSAVLELFFFLFRNLS